MGVGLFSSPPQPARPSTTNIESEVTGKIGECFMGRLSYQLWLELADDQTQQAEFFPSSAFLRSAYRLMPGLIRRTKNGQGIRQLFDVLVFYEETTDGFTRC